MKIGIEVQRLFRKKKHGMEIVALEIIKYLQKVDKNNEYIIYVKNDVDSHCIEETDNFKIKILPNYNHAFWEQIILPRHARKDNIDILHCTSNTAPVLYKGTIILTLHDIIYLEVINFRGNAYQNFGNIYRRIIVPKSVRSGNHIVTVSNYEKQNIINYFQIDSDSVSSVYNGVSKDFHPNEGEENSQVSFLDQFPNGYILFLGNTAYKKNTIGVLKAYKLLLATGRNDIPTLVITDVSASYIYGLLSAIKAVNLINYIFISDYVPYDLMPSYYQKAKVFLYPSLRESFGLPILESMACGTPVVTSNLTAMPEIASDIAVLVDPYEPAEIANGVVKILENRESLVPKMIERGIKHAQNFDWENSARMMLDVYKKVSSQAN